MSVNITISEEESKYLIRALVLNYADTHEDYDPQDISVSNITRELLISKLIRAFDNYDFYCKVKKDRFSAKEPIKTNLFMGAGHHSVVQKNNLHRRLEFACSELCGLQQNGGMGTPFDEQMDKECSNNIKSVLRDIVSAFNIPLEENETCSQ